MKSIEVKRHRSCSIPKQHSHLVLYRETNFYLMAIIPIYTTWHHLQQYVQLTSLWNSVLQLIRANNCLPYFASISIEGGIVWTEWIHCTPYTSQRLRLPCNYSLLLNQFTAISDILCQCLRNRPSYSALVSGEQQSCLHDFENLCWSLFRS